MRDVRQDVDNQVSCCCSPMSEHPVLPARSENSLRVPRIEGLIDRPSITGGTMSTALPTPSLHTARLRLRAFEDADAKDLFALHSSAYVLRYWDAPPWSERARAERFIAVCKQMEQESWMARCRIPGCMDCSGGSGSRCNR